MEEARKVVTEAVEKCLMSRHADWSKIKLVIRDTMNDFIWKKNQEKTNDPSDHYGCII